MSTSGVPKKSVECKGFPGINWFDEVHCKINGFQAVSFFFQVYVFFLGFFGL
jgi:hypothetical protein